MSGIWDFLFGTEDSFEKLNNFSPEQESAYKQIMSSLFGGEGGGAYGQATQSLMDLLNPDSDAYNRMAAPYMRQFQQEIIPGLAEQYAGAGALSSSGFGQALSSAGAGLQENLAALRTGMQHQGRQQAFNQANQAMQYQPFQYGHREGSQGLIPGALNAFAGGLGGGALGGLGNMVGRMFR